MLERYNPFRRALREKERESSYNPLSLWADWDQWPGMDLFGKGFGATDVAEDDNGITFKVDMPGINPEEIDVQAEGGTLTIRSERKSEKEEKEKTYHRIERSYGGFCRSFQLPSTVDTSSVEAKFENGVLMVEIPKTEESKTRKIKIKVK